MIRHRYLGLLVLILVGCGEKKERSSTAGSKPESSPARTERRAAGDHDEPDPRIVLRERFDQASRETDPELREKVLESVAWDAIDVDSELSREAFAALTPDSTSSLRLVGHFAMRLADEDPEKALAWAGGIDQPEERSEAFGRIAVVISSADPTQAANLISEEMGAGQSRDRAVVQVLQRWSQAAPADAAEWIATFSQGAARSAGLKTVVSAWIESDPSALAAWVEAREEGAIRTESILAVSEALRSAPAEGRASRLASFRDAEVRRQVESILSQAP